MEPVTYSTQRGVAILTLNRPERLNASTGAMSRALNTYFTDAAKDPNVHVILLKGAGKAFCAGADLQVLEEHETNPGHAKSGSQGLRYDGIMHLGKPVIAAVHGACAGIGLALACSADIRLASEDAFFIAPFAKLGLCAEGGLAWHLTRIMGRANALEMLLSARRVTAEEAYAKGLVARVVPPDFFDEVVLKYAIDMAEHAAPSALLMIKKQMLDVDEQDFEQARLRADQLTKESLQCADFKHAISARRSKVKAKFAGFAAEFYPPISA